MPDDRAFFDSYDAVELELPDGSTVYCRPLTLKRSAYWLRRLKDARTGDEDALLDLLNDFPKEVGADEAFETLTPVEFFEVLNRFFISKKVKRKTEKPSGSTI